MWLLLVGTALLAATLTVGLDRGITALRAQPTPTPTPRQLAEVVVVNLETPEPAVEPSVIAADQTEQTLRQLQQETALHLGTTFVLKAERQVTFALEALSVNDTARADRELVAAKASLDEAFRLVPEDLKPQLDTERLEIGRIRADLEINPRDLDEDLRRMRDRLLSLIAPRP